MNTLIAYFKEPRKAEKTIGALRDHGVSRRHLSLITGEENLDQLYTAAAAEKARKEGKGVTTTTADDSATGALKGAGVGLGVGALGALASLFIPGSGLVFGSGALLTASLSAIGTGGAGGIGGAVVGYLKDQGLDNSLVGKYRDALDNAGAVLAVELAEDSIPAEKAERIFKKYDAHGISKTKAVLTVSS